jgi:anti-anti-sigma regulatory factor/HAMP domain-containing protein
MIRRNIVLAYIIPVVILPLFLVIYATVRRADMTVTQTENHLESVVTLKAEQINVILSAVQFDMGRAFSTDIGVVTLSAMNTRDKATRDRAIQQISEHVNDMLVVLPDFTALVLFNSDGEVVTATEPNLDLPDFDHQALVRSTDDGQIQVFVRQPVFGSRLDNAGETRDLGVLVGRLRPEVLLDLVQQDNGLGESGATHLIDEAGNLLHGAEMTADVVSREIWLEPLQVFMQARVDRDEVLNDTRNARQMHVLLTAALVVISVGIGVSAISQRLTGPLLRLSRTARTAADGDFSVQTGINRRDEIGVLAQAFDSMTDHLNTLVGNLQHNIEQIERAEHIARQTEDEQNRLRQQILDTQRELLEQLAAPLIPLDTGIVVMPLVGSVDTARARDITRTMLRGISQHRAQTVILDISGVPVVDSGVAHHLDQSIQAARLKGARTIVTGISNPVVQTVVDLGLDWSDIETARDLRNGLRIAYRHQGLKLIERDA